MINKIKDFLKNKLSRRKQNHSDQEVDSTGNFSTQSSLEDDVPKLTLKEKFTSALIGIKSKYKGRRLKPFEISQSPKQSQKKSALLSPNISQTIEKLLSRPCREPIHQVFLVVIICSLTYSLGKISALALKGPPALDSARDHTVTVPMNKNFNPATLAQVRNSNIFRTNTGLGQKSTVASDKCESAQKASNLPIKLVNTVVLQDSVKSIASVQIRGDKMLLEVREGEQISNLAKIFKIDRLEMLIRNLESGLCESIASTKVQGGKSPISVLSPSDSKAFIKNRKMPGIENVGNQFKISKKLLDEKIKDIASILTQARAIKIQNPDGSMAFKMTEMDPEGIFPYLGLQDQDIITSINGKPIYDMNEVMSLFAKIKNLDSLSLGVKRDGSDSVQEYSIKK
jgi:type II secretion system protein C